MGLGDVRQVPVSHTPGYVEFNRRDIHMKKHSVKLTPLSYGDKNKTTVHKGISCGQKSTSSHMAGLHTHHHRTQQKTRKKKNSTFKTVSINILSINAVNFNLALPVKFPFLSLTSTPVHKIFTLIFPYSHQPTSKHHSYLLSKSQNSLSDTTSLLVPISLSHPQHVSSISTYSHVFQPRH